MPRIHVSLAGHDIKYDDPDPKTERFIKRVQALADDPKSKTDDVVALIYGDENPILDRTLFPERGAVTKEVLENPVYHVLCDLLARKQAAVSGATPEKLSKRYTLTVAEAAEQAHVSADAIRKAIKARRLPSWKRDGEYFIDPKTLLALVPEVGKRGVVTPGVLRYSSGYDEDKAVTFRLKIPGGEVPFDELGNVGRVTKWERVGVLVGFGGGLRFFELVPGDEKQRLDADPFYIEGNFDYARKVNGAAAARKAWEGFKAS